MIRVNLLPKDGRVQRNAPAQFKVGEYVIPIAVVAAVTAVIMGTSVAQQMATASVTRSIAEVDAQARGVTVTLEAPDPVPAVVDAEVLTRAYGNVVGNAVKYSPPGGEVRVRVVRDGDFVEMVCEDDGVGIPEDEQAAVFDIVRRSRDRGNGVPGAGIGLAISHRIVTRLGGGIALSSSPGRGSTFTVRVPVRPVSPS